jgi:hypothetical protein
VGLFAGLALLALLQFPPADGPPQIVLKSRAGMQVAALGSSCGPSNGAFMCLDTTEPHPSKMTLVRRGEAISIRLVGRRVLGDSEVSVRPYGCRQEALESFPLEPGDEPTGWTVDVPPGDYELHVFARYAYGKAGRGDVSGALGLRVDDSAALTVAPAPIRSC